MIANGLIILVLSGFFLTICRHLSQTCCEWQQVCDWFMLFGMEITWLDKHGNPLSWRIPAHFMVYIDLIGLDMAAKLFLELGGSCVFIPVYRNSEASSLARCIGTENVFKLSKKLSGHRRIPFARPFLARYLRSKGANNQEIARKLRVSDVTVRSYINKVKQPLTIEERAARLRQQLENVEADLRIVGGGE